MPLSDFVIHELKVTFDPCISSFTIDEPSLRLILLPLIFLQLGKHLIKPWRLGNWLVLDEGSMGCWNISNLIFHHSIHFSCCKVDAAGKLVLVIDLKPSVDNLGDVRLENFANR